MKNMRIVEGTEGREIVKNILINCGKICGYCGSDLEEEK
jgi:hypothetical protein